MSENRLRIFQVDAFTDIPYRGNPAAVCLLDRERDAGWMQSVATEMNLSETAFVRPREDGEHDLRWFTPTVEVDLCGHATLASAHILYQQGLLPGEQAAVFHTRSGRLQARRGPEGILLDLPALGAEEVEPPGELLDALGRRPRATARGRLDFLAELDSEEEVRNLAPDLDAIRRLPTTGLIVTTGGGDSGFDFISRYFAPSCGIDEDPVTGAAHCCLGPYWATRTGKTAFRAYQASPRGGSLTVQVNGDRVVLGGTAVTVLEGRLCLPGTEPGERA